MLTVDVVIAILGGLFLFLGIIGIRGLRVRNIVDIPQVPSWAFSLIFLIGVSFIGISIWLNITFINQPIPSITTTALPDSTNVTSVAISEAIDAEESTLEPQNSVTSPTQEELDTIGEFGVTLAMWAYPAMIGSPPDNPVRSVASQDSVEIAGELDIDLHLEDLNNISDSGDVKVIVDKVSEDLLSTRGDKAWAMFEIRHNVMKAMFFLTGIKDEEDEQLIDMFAIIAASTAGKAARAAEQVNLSSYIISQGDTISEDILALIDSKPITKEKLGEFILRLLDWESQAIDALQVP